MFRTLGLIALAAAVILFAATAAPCQQGQVFHTAEILGFDVLVGQPQWRATASQRVRGARWTFDSNGGFVFAPSNARTDLYPVRGRYWEVRRGVYRFQATASSTTGTTGRAYTVLEGEVDFTGSRPVLRATWSSGNANAAVINNLPMGASSSSSYAFAVTLSR